MIKNNNELTKIIQYLYKIFIISIKCTRILLAVALFGVGEVERDRGSEAVPTQKAAGGSFMTT